MNDHTKVILNPHPGNLYRFNLNTCFAEWRMESGEWRVKGQGVVLKCRGGGATCPDVMPSLWVSKNIIPYRHREERSDEAIRNSVTLDCFASLTMKGLCGMTPLHNAMAGLFV